MTQTISEGMKQSPRASVVASDALLFVQVKAHVEAAKPATQAPMLAITICQPIFEKMRPLDEELET
jgi:hypothetical protein